MTEIPRYVLKFNEGHMTPKHESVAKDIVKKINLYGVYEGILYKYKKDGTLNTPPSYHRTVDSICNFYTVFEPDIDFVKIIETYTPIKIEFSES